MILLGILLIILGVVFGIGILQTLGVLLLVLGLVLLVLGTAGPVGGRWW
jgi:hypothetical protein